MEPISRQTVKKSRLKKSAFILFLLAAIPFFSIAAYILVCGFSDRVDRADAIVVFGNQVGSNGEPSPRLKARLDKAVQLFREGDAPVIIVSGGIEANGFDEAAVMKSYLLKNGIPGQCIYTDNQGEDTYRSGVNTALLMRQNGWTRIIVVSQYFHIARARLVFEQLGIPTVYTAHADYFEPRDLYSLGREVIALIVYRLRRYA
jgi:vancomycin permeability regulator SanA